MARNKKPEANTRLNDGQRLAWLRLIRSENVGPATFRDLLDHFGNAVAALDALPDLAARGGAKRAIKVAHAADAEAEIANTQKIGGELVVLGDDAYPARLATLDPPPPVVAVAGDDRDTLDLLTQTLRYDGALVTAGGRVLNVTAMGATIVDARELEQSAHGDVFAQHWIEQPERRSADVYIFNKHVSALIELHKRWP